MNFDPSGITDSRQATRMVLLAIILLTLPCYCLGAVLLANAPGDTQATAKPTNPTLGEIMEKTDKAVIGGVDQVGSLMVNSPERVIKEAEKAWDETGGKRWMLGSGCTFSPQVPEENLMAIRKVFDLKPA